jgi:hypothetical protein
MLKRFAAALLLRRVVRALDALAAQHTAQTALLARLADRFAPILPVESPGDRATIKAETGVSHLDVGDAELAQYFVARTQAQTGHVPDEDEILLYLADEKTQDLAERLTAREAELQRLVENRQ